MYLTKMISPALEHLKKTNGYVVALSSIGAQLRNRSASDCGLLNPFRTMMPGLKRFVQVSASSR